MSALIGKVGAWNLKWLSVPRGTSGSAYVQLNDKEKLEVRWRKDADGIWIELPDGVYGFDIDGAQTDDGSRSFRMSQRESSNQWSELSFVRAGEEQMAQASSGVKKSTRIRAQMPGKIVRILVKQGQDVEKDQPLVVMEAMKMENEIRAPQGGKVSQVKVAEGQAVETGADLVLVD